jgi:hypothetical protein
MAFEPSRQAFKDASDEAYSKDPKSEISDSLNLVFSSPTIKAWKRDNTVLVGIRGTQDARDIVADGAIALGRLDQSARFQGDLSILNQLTSTYAGDVFYGAGHSLGAAILDLMISRKLIYKGVSYNGALQLGREETANQRVYAKNDVLGYLSRPFLALPAELREKKSPMNLSMGPIVGGIKYFLDQHSTKGIGAGRPPHTPRRYSVR